ncbi:angiopoietin-related protein 6-like [Sabethes cyaneus]|uniref:angiopoietin-related protein 6-like n=1 Tax=Sabethes cyaneus TaxID=53552 RepID=UPI00237D4DE6|nr:angiopoietin-related protein 6-like [Sabethes cyaneus]
MECSDAFEVYCDQEYEGGGWLVIQNRYQSSVSFYRGWKEYEAGFGDLRGEFWLGLKKIHEITNAKAHELLIILEDFDGKVVTAQYDRFLVGGPGTKYVLRSLGTYTGTAGDSLRYHAGMKFSTFDNDSSGKDNDKYNHNCAVPTKGGWWYKNSDDNDRNCAEFWNGCWHRICAQSNLNGLYLMGHKPERQCIDKVCWIDSRRGMNYGLKRSRMMIRAFNNV